MKHGLIIGKFYPPHIGHLYLIRTAAEECDEVTVVAMYSSVENIAIENRVRWLEEVVPENVRVLSAKDDTPVMYTDETWGYFLETLMETLNLRHEGNWHRGPNDQYTQHPNVIYSGESYAPEFASRLLGKYQNFLAYGEDEFFPTNIDVRIIDRADVGTEVAATNVRNNMRKHWDILLPGVKRAFARRVVICGAESSGTTTLAKALGDHYKTTVVPEYGRHFDWAVGKHHKWTDGDFLHIALEQRRWEDMFAEQSHGGLLICDTDEFATAMFSKVYLGEPNQAYDFIKSFAEQTPADLYIVTSHKGIDFEDDGTRYNSGKRPWMTTWFNENLPQFKVLGVQGRPEQRLAQAVFNIDILLDAGWNIADPLEYRENQEEALREATT